MHRLHPAHAVIQAPCGPLGLYSEGGCLIAIEFLPPDSPLVAPADPLTRRAAAQLAAYFRDPRAAFDLPLCPQGSPFRRRVWQAVLSIPSGATRTYGEIAASLATSARAVGQALGDNPLPIVVPCHRVVGRHGLGGFDHCGQGAALDIKRWLLRHEGALGH